MINRQDSRHRIKRSNLTGVVPTAHTASTDFTDGTWLNTDLREAEFFYNIPDKKLWIGTGTSSIEIAQIGSTTSGNSLEQTLAIGNNSGTNNIIMGTATVIKSANGTSSISLDYAGVGGDILLSTDGSILADKYIWLGNSIPGKPLPTVQIKNQTGDIHLEASNTIKLDTAAAINLLGNTIGLYNQSSDYAIEVTSGAVSILDDDYGDVTVNFNNSAVNLSASVPINFDTYTKVKNTNYGAFNVFDIKSAVTTSTASIQLTTGLSTTIVSTVQGTSSTTTQEISENGGLKMSHTSGSDSGLTYQKIGAVSTTTIGTFSMANITFMANDQSFSIRGQANGYCASPNRNMGATFYASFLKYGGTIYQNGTTDIVLKDGYGDGTTPAVWTDGTNIYISVRTFSALTSTFTTSYEILV